MSLAIGLQTVGLLLIVVGVAAVVGIGAAVLVAGLLAVVLGALLEREKAKNT